MIEGLKPYAEYKESGQEWLGGVPAHWELKPGHAAFAPRKESNRGMKEKTVLSLSYGRIKVKAIDKHHGLVPESYETYQVVNEGNIIIRGTDLQNDHTSLRIGLSRNRGIISSAYLCLEAQPTITPDYGYQILNVFDLTKAIYLYGSGLRQNLDHGEIKRLPIFLPPLDEQAAIVRFLDHANRKIDRFIRAKRKLIGLLNEQKQAIIHHAVTRGLDPDVPLKPSGIPWLGDIPKHWEVFRLGRVIKLITGFPFPSDGFTQKESAVRLLRGINVTPVGLRWDSTVRWERTQADGLDEFLLQVGDIVLGMDRPIIAAGVRAASIQPQDIPSLLLQRVARLTPKERITGPFLLHLLQGRLFAEYIAPIFTGISVPHLSPEQIKGFKVMLPPVEEQEDIVAFITNETATLTTAIARTEREIALMQEYRTRLTADIVTGKLDVREAAAKLPDLPTDPAAELFTGESPEHTDILDEIEPEES
ncbi:MAG: restriction endonuclease subunit S [Candidatus Contendobacter sp.]|nr:restriction endonuclease subunit S [Candidatus Contendobacter sp.]